jgi:plasmid stability protein
MITLTIRNVKPAVLRHLQLLAKTNHRSPEDEAGVLLEHLMADPHVAAWLARERHGQEASPPRPHA